MIFCVGHIPPLTKRVPNEDYVFNNTDGLPCDTYFYSPSDSASFNLLVVRETLVVAENNYFMSIIGCMKTFQKFLFA